MAAGVDYFFYILIIGILVQESLAKTQDALPADFKFQVSLRSTPNGIHACGGSIITQKWVITTAQCANKVRNLPHIFAGSVNIPDASPRANLYEVDRIITHENFNQQTFENNIAVLQVKKTIQYSDYITNVWLPIHGQALPDTASLCGWPPQSNPLSQIKLQVVPEMTFVKQNCKSNTGVDVPLTSAEFCAFDQSTDQKACLLDVGGALTKDQVLHGLLSRGDCIMQPDILIQVSSYSNWIKSILGDDANDIKWDNTYPGTGGGGGGGASAIAQSSVLLIALISCLYFLNRF